MKSNGHQSEYFRKLTDPRWQKKRLEIFERDGFRCRGCGSSSNTLHVHHLVYRWGIEPWLVSPDDLLSLCDRCHELASDKDTIRELHRILCCGINPHVLKQLIATMVDGLNSQNPEHLKDGNLSEFHLPDMLHEMRDAFLESWHEKFARTEEHFDMVGRLEKAGLYDISVEKGVISK